MKTTAHPWAFFKCRPRTDRNGFLAWGGLQRLSKDNPVDEPAEIIHFTFGESEEQAIAKLKSEMDTAYGPRKWQRQSD